MKDKEGIRGKEIINEFVKRMKKNKGVYRMLKRDGGVIYVGKERKIKKRV